MVSGTQMTLEEYAPEIFQGGVQLYCFGAPCQDFSIAGKRAGLDGKRSVLVQEVFRLLEEQEEESRPEWLIYENVKGMFSSNHGLDYLSILSEMDRLGYDCEWQNINSAWYVPQNRERIYTIGHLRRYGSAKILPIEGADGENYICQIGKLDSNRDNPSAYRVYNPDGESAALNTMCGGGREPCVSCFIDATVGGGTHTTQIARTIPARYAKGMTIHKAESSFVLTPISEISVTTDKSAEPDNTTSALKAKIHGNASSEIVKGINIANGANEEIHDPMYVELQNGVIVYAVWYEKYQCYITIRKLTPRECFRLQGWDDNYFERAEFVNSDSQLYKQAGNGVTANVVQAIGEKLKEVNEGDTA